MKFLVDNAISPKVSDGLARAGYEAIHLRDRQMQSAPDEEVMALAVREERVLIPADTDFSTLLATQRALKPSLILLRTSAHHPQMQLTLVLDSLPGLETGLKANCVVVFEGFRTRIRYLPILR